MAVDDPTDEKEGEEQAVPPIIELSPPEEHIGNEDPPHVQEVADTPLEGDQYSEEYELNKYEIYDKQPISDEFYE